MQQIGSKLLTLLSGINFLSNILHSNYLGHLWPLEYILLETKTTTYCFTKSKSEARKKLFVSQRALIFKKQSDEMKTKSLY